MVVEYTEAALIDLENIVGYYAEVFGKNSALKVYKQIKKTVSSLGMFDNAGLTSKDSVLRSLGYREIYSGRFVIIYRVDKGEKKVYIYHVADTQRDYPHLFTDLSEK